MNGALTIGTRDGATIEMAEEAGEENFFLFGLTADQVAGSRGWYNPHWHYEHEPETHKALDLIFSDHFNPKEPGIFEPLREPLISRDHYMHLADLKAYLEADRRLLELYADPPEWTRRAILNIASSGKFSSDRSHRRVRRRNLGREALPGAVEFVLSASAHSHAPEVSQGGVTLPAPIDVHLISEGAAMTRRVSVLLA
jgi:glucan phosphorylase